MRFLYHVVISLAVIPALLVIALWLLPYRPIVPYAQVICSSNGTVLHAFLSPDHKWRMKTELHEISPTLRKAFIAKEDRWFYYHPGINPLAVLRALVNNTRRQRTTSGASTITMQVARLLEPKPRTLPNKLLEVWRALQLEVYYSKDEILQLYLNLVPYGGNIEGVKAASVLYFGQQPAQLSLAQATALAVIPNRPVSLRIGSQNHKITEARNQWLRQFAKRQLFDQRQIEDALLEPLEAHRKPTPRLAPHYALQLRKRYPNQANITGTLHAGLQAKVENITANYSRRLLSRGIANAAVLVINNQTGGVEVYIGSPDFEDYAHAGQVDGVQALRSPGSTLKPYLYAVAFEKGLLTPETRVTDVPVNFADYSPENFDKQYHGSVSIETALAYSLNIPAVEVLHTLGVALFADKLSEAGFKWISQHKNRVGLSLILGGCGTTLHELALLYSAMARGGKWLPAKWLNTGGPVKPVPLISPGSAFMITNILSQLSRPDLPNNAESSIHVPRIAWKTGTSYGRRDAWSIGYNQRYTVAVWLGNFNGKGVPELTGADIATPLLFEIFNTIDYNSPNNWFAPPKEVDFRLVCAETGLLPGEYCSNQVVGYYLPALSPMQTCTHLKETCISADERFSYCTACLPEAGYKRKLYPNLPPALVTYYDQLQIAYLRPPIHNPACTRVFKEQPPQITSPTHRLEYLVEKQEPEDLLLACHTPPDVNQVYWYINEQFYKAAAPGSPVFYKPKAGPLKISCSDDKGKSSSVEVVVKYY